MSKAPQGQFCLAAARDSGMNIRMEPSRWHRLQSRTYLFLIGFTRGMTLGTRTLLYDGERIFLIRHTYMPGWQLPGGGIEPGETAEASMHREVLEETGYRVTGPAELCGFYHNAPASPRDHVALFLCRDFEKAFEFKPNLEIAEFGWFALDTLPEAISDATRRRIAEVFHGAKKSAVW